MRQKRLVLAKWSSWRLVVSTVLPPLGTPTYMHALAVVAIPAHLQPLAQPTPSSHIYRDQLLVVPPTHVPFVLVYLLESRCPM